MKHSTTIAFPEDTLAGKRPRQWTARAERVDRDILLIHDALPMLPELIDLAQRHAHLFNPSTVIHSDRPYSDSKQRSSQSLVLTDERTPEVFAYYDTLCRAVEGNFILTYQRFINPHAITLSGSGYELLRYGPGDYFHEHVDAVVGHPILATRRLAVVAFCNDDFEGGELHFSRQEVMIKPETGALVIFPASFTHPHASKPIVRGLKYSLVTWFF